MNLPRPAPGHTFAIALGLVALITPLAVHLFLPVIPAAKVALGLSDAMAQLNFSIALLAMAFATLVYGSLSDRYGRRPMLLSGLLLFLAGSAIAALAETAATLLLGRVVQAVGAACGMTLVRTIARDAYRTEHLVRAISYLTMFYTLGPMVSPLFGGLLIDTLGWRSVFIICPHRRRHYYGRRVRRDPGNASACSSQRPRQDFARLFRPHAGAAICGVRAPERIEHGILYDHGERSGNPHEGAVAAPLQ